MTKTADMAKGGNKWDNSALFKALEDAIAVSNYKRMHKMGNTQSPGGVEGSVSSAEKNANLGADESNKAVRMPQESRSKTKTPQENHSKTKTAKTENPPPGAESGMDSQPAQEDMSPFEEYNRLLREYYEVEEKRAKLMRQLYGDWNYQYPQGYGTTAYQGYYSSPMWAVSGYLYPHRAWQPCACPGCCACVAVEPPTYVDNNRFKTGIAASQRAMSSMRIGANGGNAEAPMTSSATDLSTVLNAWYSAGLLTGKYLSEQSPLKRTIW